MISLDKERKNTKFNWDKVKFTLILLTVLFALYLIYLIIVNIKYIYPYILVLFSLVMFTLGFVLMFKNFDDLYSDSVGYLVFGIISISIGLFMFLMGTANTPILENIIAGIFGVLKLTTDILDVVAKPFLDLISIIASLLGD